MSGDFETLEINQPKIKYLKPEDNTEWLDKLINNIEDMKNKMVFQLRKVLMLKMIIIILQH